MITCRTKNSKRLLASLFYASCFFYAQAAPAGRIKDAEKLVACLKKSAPYIEDASGNRVNAASIEIIRVWKGDVCQSSIINTGSRAIRINNIVLFEIDGSLSDSNCRIYGEGFQKLSQLGGTLANPKQLGGYSDEGHYKLVGPHNMPTAYGLFNVTLPENSCLLLGFSTCQKFIGRISFNEKKIMVSIDGENLLLKPGQRMQLEDFMALAGTDKNALYEVLSKQITKTHPPIFGKKVPVGWCSWYCYGPSVTQKDIQENLKGFAETLPGVKYIQIDDGFQPFMGDWLDENPAYGSLARTLGDIKKAGFVPAIWLAPFIAEKKSRLFREHPDWFVKDSSGQPLNSATVGFGGWRNGPWYVLDGTHPQVQAYLKYVVRTMREKWGVQYFKLDANYWGAIHKGIHYDTTATRIQAYRAGMKAILEACDSNTVVLGCNAPVWPSLGLVTANRTSNDVSRDWASFQSTARENLLRAWQNGKLWYNDPDCLVLAPNDQSGTQLTQNEFMFHASVVHAIGGLVLLGDKYANLSEKQFVVIRKALNPAGKGAQFNNDRFETGVMDLGKEQYYYFFNWDQEKPVSLKIKLKSKALLKDYWQDTTLGIHQGEYEVNDLPPHSAKIIKASAVQ
jgi:alpha-galactosidase